MAPIVIMFQSRYNRTVQTIATNVASAPAIIRLIKSLGGDIEAVIILK